MSIIWEIIKSEKKKSKQYAELLLDFDRVLGLDLKIQKKKKIFRKQRKNTNTRRYKKN